MWSLRTPPLRAKFHSHWYDKHFPNRRSLTRYINTPIRIGSGSNNLFSPLSSLLSLPTHISYFELWCNKCIFQTGSPRLVCTNTGLFIATCSPSSSQNWTMRHFLLSPAPELWQNSFNFHVKCNLQIIIGHSQQYHSTRPDHPLLC